ncbi:MAG: hypothetical protein AB7F94_10615, partial [Nitrospira sp.]
EKLLSVGIGDFILASRKDLVVDVRWYLPSIVKSERQYQMIERANRLLGHVQKVEALLGHKLNITEEGLAESVESAIKKQIELHELKEVPLDPSQVDWHGVVQQSVFRRAPFARGETEKGFRDAVLLEIFCQITATLPKSPQTCRVVLLTNDQLLTEAAKARTSDRNNVFVVPELESLKTFLNALAAQLTQQMVDSLLPKAGAIFFEKDNAETLYYKADVWKKTKEKFDKVIRESPGAEFLVVLSAILITSEPTFLAKSGQTLSFSNRFLVQMEATKRVIKQPEWQPSAGVTSSVLSPQTPYFSLPNLPTLPDYSKISIGSLGRLVTQPSIVGIGVTPQPPTFEEIKQSGEHLFEATWTVTLKSNGTLVGAKLQDIEHKSTAWKA